MKNLGTKRDTSFVKESPEMPSVSYPKIDLPLTIIEGKDVKRTDEITLTLKGKITGFEDNEWRKIITVEVTEGEIVGKDKKPTKDNESLIS
jgi:hypothetical protein